jgi:hypothetical protein
VGSTPTRATAHKKNRVGWALACPSGCNPPARGAMQVRLLPDALVSLRQRTIGPFVYRHRTAAPQAAKAGSIPARVNHQKKRNNFGPKCISTRQLTLAARLGVRNRATTNGQVVQLVDTRRSERRAHTGLGVRLSPWSLERQRNEQIQQGGQCPVEPHKLQVPGATPGPATNPRSTEVTRTTAGYANRKSGGVESAVILWVRLPPRSLV